MQISLFPCLSVFVQLILSIQPVFPPLYFVKQAKSWAQARSYCRQMYTDLATIKSYEELLNFRAEVARQRVLSPFWIGLYNDVNSWRWSFRDYPLADTTLLKWLTGEPNNSGGNEECVFINVDGNWSDAPCSQNNTFICYNAVLMGAARFVGVTSPLNWTDALAFCRQFHTDLARALDKEENSLIQQVASGLGRSWIGLYRDTWKWWDGTKALYTPWNPGKPNNAHGTDNCGSIYNGLFDDRPCSYNHYFFCVQIPKINKQIVRLQVNSDPSVFDPAVQSSILKMIMQKLKDHGLEVNITLTWRVQPDGNVFGSKERKDEM